MIEFAVQPAARKSPAERAVNRIQIPAVGLDAPVLPASLLFENGQLEYEIFPAAAAHYLNGAAPGENGNVVLAGHVATRGGVAVFRALPQVSIGDEIDVTQGTDRYRYVVSEIRILPPSATEVTRPTREARLTLITCLPGREFRDRFVVLATPVS